MNELTIHLDTKRGVPLYEQIYGYIKNEIQQGYLCANEKLPSTRALAKYLGTSRSTVDLAYEQLLSEGFIEAIPYKGYFINKIDLLFQFEPTNQQQRENSSTAQKEYEYDFTPNGIELDSFPYNAWRKLSKNILLEDNQEMFQMGDPKGEYALRETISRYLHQARGVLCKPEQVIIGAGSDYLFMMLPIILGSEHRVAMENPTYKKAFHILNRLGFKTTAVDSDKNGIDEKALEESGADLVYVMPSHQFPLGVVMPIKRRLELLKWAEKKEGRYILEDDYDSEFRYIGKPIPALQGYDRAGKVIYMGTFSKSIAPAIRVAYMVLPEQLLPCYEKNASSFSSSVSRVDQKIIREFLEQGYYERHMNKMRGIYKNKHDLLLKELKSIEVISQVKGANAGVHLLVQFQNGMTEEEAVSLAKKEKINLYPVSDYLIQRKIMEPTILLGFATIKEEEIKPAIQRLKAAWDYK